jgi:hypothetical protein
MERGCKRRSRFIDSGGATFVTSTFHRAPVTSHRYSTQPTAYKCTSTCALARLRCFQGEISGGTLEYASDTSWPSIRFYLRPMLRWRAIATRYPRGYQSSTSRRWLHGNSGHDTRPSRHAHFYSDLVPAMIPVALLGSAVYMVRKDFV